MEKHSLMVMGHATSLSLEPEFWAVLRSLAREKEVSLAQLISRIDCSRHTNLSSAVRVYILTELQKKIPNNESG